MFKFTDEQKAYIFEKLDDRLKEAESQTAEMKVQFEKMKENIDNLSPTGLIALFAAVSLFDQKEEPEKYTFIGGFNGKPN